MSKPPLELVKWGLDVVETRALAEFETTHNETVGKKPDELGEMTYCLGSWYLRATYSRLARLDDRYHEYRTRTNDKTQFPFLIGERDEEEVFRELASRFVVSETDRWRLDNPLQARTWKLVAEFQLSNLTPRDPTLEEAVEIEKIEAPWRDEGVITGSVIYECPLEELSRLVNEAIEKSEHLPGNRVLRANLVADYLLFIHHLREAFLEWLRALRGVSLEALANSPQLWFAHRYALAGSFTKDGVPLKLDKPE